MRRATPSLLRRLAGHPRALPVTALLLRGRTVRPMSAFVAREALRRGGCFVYALRENGLQVAIRHGTGDVVTLGEVFHERDYAPPPEVEHELGGISRILDLGANIGLFGAFAASRWPQAEIVAFEPDPANAAVHARTIAANGLQSRWRLSSAAAGAGSGRARFLAGGIALSRFSESPPRALVLEYHPQFCTAPDPRQAVESALAAAGFHVHSIWHRADHHGMLWAWRS